MLTGGLLSPSETIDWPVDAARPADPEFIRRYDRAALATDRYGGGTDEDVSFRLEFMSRVRFQERGADQWSVREPPRYAIGIFAFLPKLCIV
jgi:hypothetical protein